MTSLEIVGLVAIILISAFAVIAIIVAIPLFRLLNKVRFMADRLSESLIPMVGKLNDTVTHLNTEVGSLTDLTQSISSIIRLARVLITSPLIKLISASAGIISGLGKTGKGQEEE